MLLQQVALTEQLAVIMRTQKLHWGSRPSVNDHSCDFDDSCHFLVVVFGSSIALRINHFHCFYYTFLGVVVVQSQCNTVRAVEGLVDMRPLRALLGIGDSGAVCS